MFQATRTRIALAAATLAIVATSFVPAVTTLAAPLTPSQEGVMTAKSDVSVTGAGINGGDTTYWTGGFNITNKGPAANNVKLTTYCMYNDRYTHQYKETVLGSPATMSLPANLSVPAQKAVTCPGRLGFGDELWAIQVNAYVPAGDANTANNGASVKP